MVRSRRSGKRAQLKRCIRALYSAPTPVFDPNKLLEEFNKINPPVPDNSDEFPNKIWSKVVNTINDEYFLNAIGEIDLSFLNENDKEIFL